MSIKQKEKRKENVLELVVTVYNHVNILKTTELYTLKECFMPGSARLSWPCIAPQSERSKIQFVVRAHAWVAGSVAGWGLYLRQPINVSLPSPPSKNKLKYFMIYELNFNFLKRLIV